MFLWFAATFWIYLETKSVLVTAVIGGAFSLISAGVGMYLGTYVDHHRKRTAMILATVISVAAYVGATLLYATGPRHVDSTTSPRLWLMVLLILIAAVAGNLRTIALSTCVTLLIEESERDKANGAIGTSTGVLFIVTSVMGGLIVGQLGFGWSLGISLVVTVGSLVHILGVRVPEDDPVPTEGASTSKADFRGAIEAIRSVPGLSGLVMFAAFNNLIGGVFMALMDAYGLSLMSVEAWGLLFAVTSLGFVIGGLAVARWGLGSRPLRMILIGNLVSWIVCCVFTLRSSGVLLAAGMLVWLTFLPVVEAAEQTVLQRVVPFERQGRVFGFAQTIENAAAPITAFAIGPIAQFWAIPFMTDGKGADWIGGWFGVGRERGMALIFTLAGLVGLAATVWAMLSPWYRRLADVSQKASDIDTPVPVSTP